MADPLVLSLLNRHLLIYISQRLCTSLQLLIALPDVALALEVIWRRFWPILFILHRETRGEKARQMSARQAAELPYCFCSPPSFVFHQRCDAHGQCWPQDFFVLLIGSRQ